MATRNVANTWLALLAVALAVAIASSVGGQVDTGGAVNRRWLVIVSMGSATNIYAIGN